LLNVYCTFANIEVERVIECSNMSVYTSNQGTYYGSVRNGFRSELFHFP